MCISLHVKAKTRNTQTFLKKEQITAKKQQENMQHRDHLFQYRTECSSLEMPLALLYSMYKIKVTQKTVKFSYALTISLHNMFVYFFVRCLTSLQHKKVNHIVTGCTVWEETDSGG